MDHRALEQTNRINDTGAAVLRYVGGTISVEMQTPKLLWLKENLPETWRRTARFFDLPDYLTYRATGLIRVRCVRRSASGPIRGIWTRRNPVASAAGMRVILEIGLGDLADEGFRRIGQLSGRW